VRKRVLILVGLMAILAAVCAADITSLWAVRDINKTYWHVNTSGMMLPGADKSYDIGSSSFRPRYIYGNRQVTSVNASNTTLTSANVGVVALTNMTGNHTLTLPTATSAGIGAVITVIDTGGLISSTGNLTVNVTSSGNINGGASFNVNNITYEQAVFTSNGSAWFGGVLSKATSN